MVLRHRYMSHLLFGLFGIDAHHKQLLRTKGRKAYSRSILLTIRYKTTVTSSIHDALRSSKCPPELNYGS